MIKMLNKSLITFTLVIFSFPFLSASIPSGYYYFVKNKKKAELKTALHTYCGPMKELDYGGGAGFTWEGFFSTDRRADSTVIDMYSNTVRKQTSFAAVNGMHIEHSFPKSWWGAYPNNAYKDLFHLYPADASANESKNNLPLGEVAGTPTFTNGVTKVGVNGFGTSYTDKCFEPADEFKGDFARSYFYIASVYENLAPLMQSPMVINNSTYPFWKPWAIDLLLKWSKQDPVSAKELTRIEAVYNIQGNRNPFIDYPDLADYIWGRDTANVFPFPTETEPFLITPRRGTTIDFGVILQNDSRTQKLHIQGANISSNVAVRLKRSTATLALSVPLINSANALAGIDLTLTFTPSASGWVRDTLIIEGGGLVEALHIPIKALASADFITLEPTDISPVGGTLQWIADPLATNYRLNVFQNEQHAGDLIISSYVEGSSWNKAIELYNGTGKTVDLSKYILQKQSNGAGYFGSTLKLSGTLDNGKSYVIIHKLATSTDLIVKSNLVTDTLLQYNGNDAIALVRSGVTIDMAGQANAGADVMWGVDVTLQRKNYVTHPSSVFNASEWTTLPIDTYTNLGNHQMVFTAGPVYTLKDELVGLNTTYPIQNLNPNGTAYTYSVESMRSGVVAPAINSMQLHTAVLDVPEISDPSGVQYNQFTANWGASPYASGYLLDVFELSGQNETTETEGFNNVGSSGTPLPTGWAGNANAVYTSGTSFGVATPSIQFRNAGEWIQTKDYPHSVTKLSFMYRFVTAVTGASLIVDGKNATGWVRIDSVSCKNNTKTTPTYNFDKAQNITAFKFIFNKLPGGNFAIDDIAATFGNQDTTFISKNKVVSTNYSIVDGLKENYDYFYRVKASLNGFASENSETMAMKTLVNTANFNPFNSRIMVCNKNNQISISGMRGNELIQVFSTTGICVYQSKANSTEKEFSLPQNGLFIIRIQNKAYTFVTKIIH